MSDNPKPLILLTRPRAASERFGAELAQVFGAAALRVTAPLMEIAPLLPVPDLSDVSGVIFTSKVAAQIVGADPLFGRKPAWCVGARTAEAAAQAGFDALSADGAADDLVAMILSARPTGPLVHLHGRHTRGDIAARLRDAGLEAHGLAIYDQIAAPVPTAFLTALTHPGLILVPLFSPRSARLFTRSAGPRAGRDITPIALSAAVKAELPEDWKQACHISADPTGPAMIGALRNFISR